MTIKSRGIQRFLGICLLVAGMGLSAGCTQIDVSTEEGMKEALQTRQKLDKAIPKITNMMTHPEELNVYLDELVKLYKDGSSFDRDIIQAIAALAKIEGNKDKVHSSLLKAAESPDYKQVMQAAIGARYSKDLEVQQKLLARWDDKKVGVNPEVRRVILETGLSFESPEITNQAIKVLEGQLDETSFVLLRTSCDVLAYQKDPKAVDTLMKVVYHQDNVGRSLTPNCTRALVALDKAVVGPVLLKAFKLENKELMKYVEAHPDTLTPETIRNNTANALALYRYKEAVGPMLDYIENTKTIAVPGTLAIRSNTDPAWQMWANLVGVAAQSTMFAINDIGVPNDLKDRAKQTFTDIFNWTTPYQSKFKNAIELTGTTNIEVSQRVNAFRLLRENNLISNEETLAMIQSLKGEEFTDERRYRQYARASIGTDMVTYTAITSTAEDLDTLWSAFNAMKADVFNVPKPEDPDAPQHEHWNDNISKRIDEVKPAFELAKNCGSSPKCYAEELKKNDLDNYSRVKIIYELGRSGDHQFFQTVCDQYKNLDVFGQLYGTKALAQLGKREDAETIRQLVKTLSSSMEQIKYLTAKPNLEGLVTTLANK